MKNKAIYTNPSLNHANQSLLFYSSNVTSTYFLHWHNEFEFLFFEEDGTITYDNSVVSVKKNSLIIVNRNELHSVENGKFCCLIVLSPFLEEGELSADAAFVRQIENDSFIVETFRLLHDEYKLKQPGYEMQIKSIVYGFLTYLVRNYKSNKVKSLHKTTDKPCSAQVNEIIKFIEKNYHLPMSTSELAEEFHITVNHMCRLFKTYIGTTPMEFINCKKIEKSTHLLNDKEKNITEIALSVGFENSSYYAKIFKKHMGVTPSEYRKYQ